MDSAKRFSVRRWLSAARHPTRRDGVIAAALLVLPWAWYGCGHLTNAWPKSLEVGSPKDGDTSVLTEKLTLTAERLEVE
jgi:hypothetical protein